MEFVDATAVTQVDIARNVNALIPWQFPLVNPAHVYCMGCDYRYWLRTGRNRTY
jgi:hypothetical protein